MNGKNVRNYSLSQQVSDRLEGMIEKGRFRVGEKIGSEKELMELFDVGRNTLREAVRALVSAGILEVRQGDGTYVRSDNRFTASMERLYAVLDEKELEAARREMEMSIARFAAANRTEEDIERLDRAFERRLMESSSVKDNTMADINFHMAVAAAGHNTIYSHMYRSLYSYLKNHIYRKHNDSEENIAKVDELHRRLCMAVKEGNGEEASSCAAMILEI